MKKYIVGLLFASACLAFQGCNEGSPMDEEQYMKQVYLVGIAEEGGMINREIDLGNAEVETFFSVAASGSLNPSEDVHVYLEEDEEAVETYNKKFRSSTDVQYQKLPSRFYSIASMNCVIKGGDSYVRLPVQIHTEGLDCDALYALPLRVKSCNEYAVAKSSTAVLMAIKLVNAYSDNYMYTGTSKNQSTQITSSFSLMRAAVAVDKNTLRIYHTGTEKLDYVDSTGLTITVNSDNSLSIAGWKNLQVVSGSGIYDPTTSTFSFEFEYKDASDVIFKVNATLTTMSSESGY